MFVFFDTCNVFYDFYEGNNHFMLQIIKGKLVYVDVKTGQMNPIQNWIQAYKSVINETKKQLEWSKNVDSQLNQKDVFDTFRKFEKVNINNIAILKKSIPLHDAEFIPFLKETIKEFLYLLKNDSRRSYFAESFRIDNRPVIYTLSYLSTFFGYILFNSYHDGTGLNMIINFYKSIPTILINDGYEHYYHIIDGFYNANNDFHPISEGKQFCLNSPFKMHKCVSLGEKSHFLLRDKSGHIEHLNIEKAICYHLHIVYELCFIFEHTEDEIKEDFKIDHKNLSKLYNSFLSNPKELQSPYELMYKRKEQIKLEKKCNSNDLYEEKAWPALGLAISRTALYKEMPNVYFDEIDGYRSVYKQHFIFRKSAKNRILKYSDYFGFNDDYLNELELTNKHLYGSFVSQKPFAKNYHGKIIDRILWTTSPILEILRKTLIILLIICSHPHILSLIAFGCTVIKEGWLIASIAFFVYYPLALEIKLLSFHIHDHLQEYLPEIKPVNRSSSPNRVYIVNK